MGPANDLVSLIVDAVTDDAALAQFTRATAQATGGVSVYMQTLSATGSQRLSTHNLDPGMVADYEAHFWTRDLWVTRMPQSVTGRATATDTYVDDAMMLRSELYNDFLRPYGDIFRCMGFASPLGLDERLVFGVHGTRGRPFDSEHVRTVAGLQPLLLRMVAARRRLAKGRGRLAERVVDAAAEPVLLLRADGRVVFANAAAVRAFAAGPLRLREGRLQVADPAFDRVLAQTLRAACGGAGGQVLTLPGGASRIAVDPLEGAAAGPGAGGSTPLAMVRFRDEAARARAALEAAARAWGLSGAERALTGALMTGASLAEHAARRGVSLATVRTQVRSVLAKAGMSRQAELVAALAAFAP